MSSPETTDPVRLSKLVMEGMEKLGAIYQASGEKNTARIAYHGAGIAQALCLIAEVSHGKQS